MKPVLSILAALSLVATIALVSHNNLRDGCGITDENAPFNLLIVRTPGGGAQLRWESCSSHLYRVLHAQRLGPGHPWTAQAWHQGQDGSSTWTDPDADRQAARFYRVQRLPGQGDQDGDGLANALEVTTYGSNPLEADTDGDLLPDGWEAHYGLSLLQPAAPGADTDGDGSSDLAEYQQGRNPLQGAVPDTGQQLGLLVYSVLE